MNAFNHLLHFTVFACVVIALPSVLTAQEAAEYFKLNCMSCHSIGGGRLTGPDLKDVTKRKDRAWLSRFLLDPKAMMDAGDAYALKLKDDARGTVMPTLPTMNKARAEALLDLIEAESKLEKSQFKGVQLSERPFTAHDVARGHDIFRGYRSLKNGGPACISCHAINGIGGFGGGTLAPDLTTVFERYGGRRTLATWLSAPALPTMQATFKTHPLEPDEVLALTAYFQYTLKRNPEDPSTARLNFVLVGLGGAILLLGLFDIIWNKRFRSVRRVLVNSAKY